MVSRVGSPRLRKPPAERRAEIVAAAAAISLADGLERITLRAVADRLGVRPGLITHYFPAVEELVAAAFACAVSDERRLLYRPVGTPLDRVAWLTLHVQGPQATDLSRLWLNARHLSRFSARLAESVEEQEALDRAQLSELIDEGVRTGDFQVSDPFEACVRILIAIDGFGAYANSGTPFTHASFTEFVSDVVEWSLHLEPGALREAAERLAR